MVETRTGKCVCGAVSFTAELPDLGLLACHCGQCRAWTGSGPLVNVRVSNIDIEGTENIATYHASEWGERAFCKTCGSTLYWRMQNGDVKSIAAGLLDDQSGLTMKEEIFVDHRPGWMPAWDGASQSTEQQEFAKLRDFLEGDSQ